MNVVKVWDGAMTTLVDSTTTTGYKYIGEAVAGSNTTAGKAAAIWRISRINTTTSDVEWADSKFTQIWNNRASLTYA